MLKNKILLLLLCCVLVGCSKDEPAPVEDSITTENDLFVVDQSAGSCTLSLSATGNWTAGQDRNSVSWCHIATPSGTSEDHSINLNIDENTLYYERNAAIYLRCGTAEKIVTVTQKQKDAIIVNSNKVELKPSQQEFKIKFTTNLNVTYEIEADAQEWIQAKTTNQSRAMTDKVFTFTASANTSFSPRQGTIILKADNGKSEEINVYQEGEKPTLILTSPGRTIIDSKGGDLKIELKSNVEYRMILPKVSWIKENTTRALSAYTHYLTVQPNESYDSREAKLYVESLDGTMSDSITIEQMMKCAIILAKSKYQFDESAQDFSVTYDANIQFETQFSVPWISIKKKQGKGLTRGRMNFQIDRNLETEPREGHIYFTFNDYKQEILIEQAGRTDCVDIKIRHAEETFTPPVFVGEKITGTANWGDGTQSDYREGHRYPDSKEWEINYETIGVDSFFIDTLRTISFIEIQDKKNKQGDIEDLDVEHTDWD